MRLVLRGLTIGVALLAAVPAQAQPSDPQIAAMVEALRQAAPKSSPGLYSEWGVKPAIIPGWSEVCLGRQLTATQFGNSPDTARTVVTCIARRELNKQFRAMSNDETASVRRFACWWLTGKEGGCNSGTQAAYVQKVLSFYQQARSNQPTSTPSPSPTATPSPSPSPKSST